MARRKHQSVDFLLLSAQSIIGVFNGWLQVWEPLAPPAKKQKIRVFREKMAAMERDRKQLLRDIDGVHGEKWLDLINSFEDRYSISRTPELIAERNAHREQMRVMDVESETLHGIVRSWGNDSEEAVQELHRFLSEQPNSRLAYSYLGGVLQKRCQWNESIAAYVEAERLAEYPGSANFARLKIADVLHEKGDSDAAVAQYQHVINSSPSDEASLACLAYLRMGNAMQQLGQRKKARTAWKQAIHFDNFDVVSKEARRKLKETQ